MGRRSIYSLIFVIFFSLVAFSSEATNFSADQLSILKIAKYHGEIIGYPETIQAIVFMESSADISEYKIGGINSLKFGKRAYGVAQIKLSTAKFVLRRYNYPIKFKTDEELLVELLINPEFNIEIASLYFDYLIKLYKNWNYAVVAYRQGPGWVNANRNKIFSHLYLLNMKKIIVKIIRPIN